MSSKVGVKVVAAPGYGTVDTWYLGYQCSHTHPGVFHTHDDQVHLEIVNETTGRHCEANEVGMLYATAYPRRLTPIIRYMVGDRAEWLKDLCPCGRTTPTFRLLGRGDDVLRIGYDSIDYGAIQALVTKIPGLTGMVQMQKSRIDGKDLLTIRIEAELDPAQYHGAVERLQEMILNDRPSFRDFIKKGTIAPLKIELLRPGKLALNSRTGKLIRVIDAL
jgi:phenylacetate-coenzyme A ligase PaaK-like adenylate-forming protein